MLTQPYTHGLWARTAPPAPALTALADHLRCDVAIIGAGYTGLSAALHLAQAGVDVIVLEAEEIGFGGSGRNVGLVNAGMWIMPDDVAEVLGKKYQERLLHELSEAPNLVFELIDRHKISCEAVRNGTLHCAVGEGGLREINRRGEQWLKRGADVEILDRPATAAKLGSSAYQGALLDRRAGTIQPLAYARGLAKAAHDNGARIFSQTSVLSARAAPERLWRLETPGGSVMANWIIVAGNAYIQGPWSALRQELVSLPYFNCATTPLSTQALEEILPERQGAWDTNAVLSSFRLDDAGRLIFGSVGALRFGGQKIHKEWAQRAISRIFPQLPCTSIEFSWFGRIGMTKDHVPRFHKLDRNVIGFQGYNGRGIGTGTVFGRALAGFIVGKLNEGSLPLPVNSLSPHPLRRLKSTIYEAGAQLLHFGAARL